MRTALLAVTAVLAVAVPASAADVDPSSLVLQEVDLPRGYQIDEDNSMAVPNRLLRAAEPEARRIVDRSDRVNGYAAKHTNYDPPRWKYVYSQVDVFRAPQGAKLYFDWFVQRFRRGSPGPWRATSIGDGGLVHAAHSEGPGTFVIWRERRVVSIVFCQLMNGHRKLALSLAGKQQRRIAAALR